MKKDWLYWWCDQAWLHVIYLVGVVMSCILIFAWNDFSVPAKLMCGLATLVPLHVFEENSLPGGFFYMNNLSQKSEEPLKYPQNMLTNMITNLGAEVIFIILTFSADYLSEATTIVVIFFGYMECAHHTMNGIQVYHKLKNKGKRTLYGPGTITSFVGLAQLSTMGICWIRGRSVNVTDIAVGIGIILFIALGLIILPFQISKRVKSQRFAFKESGYFEKFN